MGWYLRKSVSVGPFRFNLSGSGVGVSAGIRGFRVGSGPRGNYVHVGGAGVYYRQALRAPAVRPEAPVAPFGAIESASAGEIVDSSSEVLLEEIREKRRTMTLLPLAILAAAAGPFVALGAHWPAWAIVIIAIAGVALMTGASYRDRLAKTVVVYYDFEPAVETAFRRFTEWGQALAASNRAWYVTATSGAADRKYHAGANQLVQRQITSIRNAAPPHFRTNVPVLSIGTGRQTLYFLPDRLLIDDGTGVGAVSYRTLNVTTSRQRFIESGGAPPDATVVDHTWQYVNKNGGPDRRFSTNPRIPVCLYDELTLRTASGLHEVVQVSRPGVVEGFAAAVRHLAAVTV